MKGYPCRVILRNGAAALLKGHATIGASDDQRVVHGEHTATGQHDLWFGNGRWSYSACDHPLDIVTLIGPKGERTSFNREVHA